MKEDIILNSDFYEDCLTLLITKIIEKAQKENVVLKTSQIFEILLNLSMNISQHSLSVLVDDKEKFKMLSQKLIKNMAEKNMENFDNIQKSKAEYLKDLNLGN